LDKLQAVHDCGYLFNDLKPNNILVGNSEDKDLHKIRLIDFGISKKYLDEHGNHIK
jgi:tau tubulin kinase